MITFNPVSEEEAKNSQKLLKPGNYPFSVIKVDDSKQTKNGDPMIKILLLVYDESGGSHPLSDYLIFSETWKYKIRHFFESCSQLEIYESGNIEAEQIVGMNGIAKIGIEHDKNGIYKDKNKVTDYINENKNSHDKKADEKFHDDDVPF